ncbi:unnamed protein product [Urochloa decumbens]|uniref:DUF569 domain-containing protein n=1 Tax=Urochloa decumbens TaxID=240449 RepID=A0ABC9FY55_9POAL
MDLFPDGHHVWLSSSGRGGKYLHADDDGVGVRVSSKRASLLSAWKVHHAVSPGGQTYVLLCGAGYGRYLTVSRDPAPHGHKGRLVVQGSYDENNFNWVAWRPERVGAAGDGANEVILRHYSGYVLRANGKFLIWNRGVSADVNDRTTPMSHWLVRAIPLRAIPPQLPPVMDPYHGWFSKMNIESVVPGVPGRIIRFVRAADDGTLPPNAAWNEFRFDGRSVFELRAAVARALGEANALGIKLCARAGTFALQTPLTMDLPRRSLPRYEKNMDIVVIADGSPGAAALEYPDVDAQ